MLRPVTLFLIPVFFVSLSCGAKKKIPLDSVLEEDQCKSSLEKCHQNIKDNKPTNKPATKKDPEPKVTKDEKGKCPEHSTADAKGQCKCDQGFVGYLRTEIGKIAGCVAEVICPANSFKISEQQCSCDLGFAGDLTSQAGRETGCSVIPVIPSLTQYPRAAYSTRKLSSDYAGMALKVRRSSDKAENDIGFVKGVLDVPALLYFCRKDACSVTIWYDQSGHKNDLKENSPHSLPLIADEGKVFLLNNRPAIAFTSTADEQIENTEKSQLLVVDSSVKNQYVQAVHNTGNSLGYLFSTPALTDFSIRHHNGSYTVPNDEDYYTTSTIYVNGNPSLEFTSGAAHIVGAWSLEPHEETFSLSNSFEGRGLCCGSTVGEMLVYDSILSSVNRQMLEKLQATYWQALPPQISYRPSSKDRPILLAPKEEVSFYPNRIEKDAIYESLNPLPEGVSLDSLTGKIHVAATANLTSVTLRIRVKNFFASTITELFLKTMPCLMVKGPNSCSSYQNVVLRDSPVGYWTFGDESSSVAKDLSFTANHGTYKDPDGNGVEIQPAPGAISGSTDKGAVFFNSCMELNAASDNYAPREGDAEISIELWFQKTPDSGRGDLFSWKQEGIGDIGIFMEDTELSVYYNDYIFTRTLSEGEFHHVVFSRERGGKTSVWLDGVNFGVDGNAAYDPLSDWNQIKMRFGCNEGRYFFDGIIDEAAIYDYVLSREQVLSHFEAGTNPAL